MLIISSCQAYFNLKYMKDLLKKMAKLIRVNLHENARKLIEHVMPNEIKIEEDSVSPRLIISKEELIDGKYFYKLKYGTTSNGECVYALKTVKELEEYEILKLASIKMKKILEDTVDNLKINTFRLRNGNYLSSLSFDLFDEHYVDRYESEVKIESNLEVLYNAVKYLKK